MAEDTDKKENGVAAKVRGLESRITKVEGLLETLRRLVKAYWTDEETPESETDSSALKAGYIRGWLLPAVLTAGLALSAFATDEVKVRYAGSEGSNAVIQLDADEGDDTADTLKLRMNADGTADIEVGGVVGLTVDGSGNVTIAGTVAATSGVGAVNGSTVSATESSSAGHKTVIVLASTPIPIINGNGGTGTNWTGGVKIYDFPQGLIDIESVLVSDVIMGTNTVVARDDGGDWALGTTIEAGNTLATSTAVDLCPATSSDIWVSTNSGFLAAGVIFDGTATAKDVYFNASVDSADAANATTVTVTSATIQINWKSGGDD